MAYLDVNTILGIDEPKPKKKKKIHFDANKFFGLTIPKKKTQTDTKVSQQQVTEQPQEQVKQVVDPLSYLQKPEPVRPQIEGTPFSFVPSDQAYMPQAVKTEEKVPEIKKTEVYKGASFEQSEIDEAQKKLNESETRLHFLQSLHDVGNPISMLKQLEPEVIKEKAGNLAKTINHLKGLTSSNPVEFVTALKDEPLYQQWEEVITNADKTPFTLQRLKEINAIASTVFTPIMKAFEIGENIPVIGEQAVDLVMRNFNLAGLVTSSVTPLLNPYKDKEHNKVFQEQLNGLIPIIVLGFEGRLKKKGLEKKPINSVEIKKVFEDYKKEVTETVIPEQIKLPPEREIAPPKAEKITETSFTPDYTDSKGRQWQLQKMEKNKVTLVDDKGLEIQVKKKTLDKFYEQIKQEEIKPTVQEPVQENVTPTGIKETEVKEVVPEGVSEVKPTEQAKTPEIEGVKSEPVKKTKPEVKQPQYSGEKLFPKILKEYKGDEYTDKVSGIKYKYKGEYIPEGKRKSTGYEYEPIYTEEMRKIRNEKLKGKVTEDLTPVEKIIVKEPRDKIPEAISEKVKEKAENLLKEVEDATVEKHGAYYNADLDKSTPAYTINTFPEWFRDLGMNKKNAINALRKIITDKGQDKGVSVEKVKKIILEHLTQGRVDRDVSMVSGKRTSNKEYFTEAEDKQLSEFLKRFEKDEITIEEFDNAVKEMAKRDESFNAETIKQKKLADEVEKLYNEREELQSEIAKGDAFGKAEKELADVNKKITDIEKQLPEDTSFKFGKNVEEVKPETKKEPKPITYTKYAEAVKEKEKLQKQYEESGNETEIAGIEKRIKELDKQINEYETKQVKKGFISEPEKPKVKKTPEQKYVEEQIRNKNIKPAQKQAEKIKENKRQDKIEKKEAEFKRIKERLRELNDAVTRRSLKARKEKAELLERYGELKKELGIEDDMFSKKTDMFGEGDISRQQYKQAKENLGKLPDTLASVSPKWYLDRTKDLLVIGKFHFQKTANNFKGWTARMVNSLGEWIKPKLKALWDEINQTKLKEYFEKKGITLATSGLSITRKPGESLADFLARGEEAFGKKKKLVPKVEYKTPEAKKETATTSSKAEKELIEVRQKANNEYINKLKEENIFELFKANEAPKEKIDRIKKEIIDKYGEKLQELEKLINIKEKAMQETKTKGNRIVEGETEVPYEYNEKMIHPDIKEEAIKFMDENEDLMNFFRRKRINIEQMKRKAIVIANKMTDNKIIKLTKGDIMNPEELVGASIFVSKRIKDVIKDPKKTEYDIDKATVMFAKVYGMRSEYGRGLRFMQEVPSFDLESIKEFGKFLPEKYKADFAKLFEEAKRNQDPEFLDIFRYWVYNAMLSRPITHARNMVGNISHITFEALTLMPDNPREVIRGLKNGYKNIAPRIKEITKGDVTETNKFFEGKRYEPKNKWVRNTMPLKWLELEDVVFKELSKGIEKELQIKSLKKEYKETTETVTKFLQDVMEGKELETEAKTERYLKALDEIEDFAKYVTFQKPLGQMGEHISAMTKYIFPIIPFVRTPINILKTGLQPLRLFKFLSPKFREEYKQLSPVGKQHVLRRIMVGAFFYSIISSLALRGDIEITGNGPDDRSKKDFLERQGWRPNSIGAFGHYISYQNIEPLNIIFAMIGNLSDNLKYNWKPKDDELNILQKISKGLAGATQTFTDQSYLQGLSNFFKWQNTENPYYLERFALMGIPNVLGAEQDIQIFQGKELPSYEAKTLSEKFLNKIGFTENLKERLDIFGQPKTRSWESLPIPYKKKTDALAKLFLDKNVTIGFPKKDVIKPNGEKITEDEYYDYHKMSGNAYEKIFLDKLSILEKMTDSQLDGYVDDIVQKERKLAKYKLFKIIPK